MKSTLTDHSPKMKCKDLVIFVSHRQNNLHISLFLTLSPSVLTFTDSVPCVYTSLQKSGKALSTQAGYNLYKTGLL